MGIIVYTGKYVQDGWCNFRFLNKNGERVTQFIPENVFQTLGFELDKPYRVSVEQIEHEYI